jgi:demethoxyubiquinone hydroxylase (CLK1/Coq7/Cat5 family)
MSLGFVVETEHQVEAHLQSHMQALARERPSVTRDPGANEG